MSRLRGWSVLLCAAGCAVVARAPSWQLPPQPFGAVSDDIVARLIADGQRAFDAGDDADHLDEALRAWRAAYRYRPADAALLVSLSRAARRRGKADDAAGYAERALCLDRAWCAHAVQGGAPSVVLAGAASRPALEAYAEALDDFARANAATRHAQQPWIDAARARARALP